MWSSLYLSMAFGNPYGEEYHRDLVLERLLQAESIGSDLISLAIQRVKAPQKRL